MLAFGVATICCHPACRTEYIRLLEQALGALGYHEAAQQLERESGVALEPLAVGQLRAAVSTGAFDKAAALMAQLPLSSPAQMEQAQFLVYEQKFLEVSISDLHTPKTQRQSFPRVAHI